MKKTTTYHLFIILLSVLCLGLFLGIAQSTLAASPETNLQQQTGVYHTVQWGETLSQIAVTYGSTIQAIMAANPAIPYPNLIYAGMVLYIPSNGAIIMPPIEPPATTCRYYHTIQYGQTMLSIGNMYGVSPFVIAEANQIFNLNRIYAGQVLCIP